MYYKLGQACVTNWGSFVLLQIRANIVTNWGSFIIINWGSYYKLGQPLLQNGAAITNWDNIYYKLGHKNISWPLFCFKTLINQNQFGSVFLLWLYLKMVHMLLNSLKAFKCTRTSKNSDWMSWKIFKCAIISFSYNMVFLRVPLQPGSCRFPPIYNKIKMPYSWNKNKKNASTKSWHMTSVTSLENSSSTFWKLE